MCRYSASAIARGHLENHANYNAKDCLNIKSKEQNTPNYGSISLLDLKKHLSKPDEQLTAIFC